MTKFRKLLAQYDYSLPESLIAQEPAHPRDSARLLVFNRLTGEQHDDIFANLGEHLPKNAVLVFNETKVIPARLTLTKPTGGLARVLYIGHDDNEIEVLADRRLDVGAMLNLRHSERSGVELRNLTRMRAHIRVRSFAALRMTDICFLVTRKEGSHYFLKPSFPMAKLFFVLEKYGSPPIPPYIKHSPLSEAQLKKEYQTVFAHTRGSVAAPTASLHFTKRLLEKLVRAGIAVQYVTLHVNLGTFASLTEQNVQEGRLHIEYFSIAKSCAAALNFAKQSGRPIIAVGTTVARTLESASDARGNLKSMDGATRLFIRQDYKFKFIDGLITNFHVPKSSLLMLVSALVGRKKLFELYRHAIQKKYRFFSFGDGMLIY